MSDQSIQGSEVARTQPIGNLAMEFGGQRLPPSLQILLNDGVYERVKQLAGVMSRAQGLTPTHLIGKSEACFAVINIALDARLNPHFVARHTYQTPAGSIGYDGALVQAMLETSGQFIGAPKLEYRGDWSTLVGKFLIKEGQRGGKFPVPTWTADDALGLGIIVRWQVKGEDAPRVWPGENEPFQLVQCFPLNSPLWATDPKTQIAYLAIRRFANQAAPGILGAAAYDEAEFLDASERARDVTPGAELDQPAAATTSAPLNSEQFAVVDLDGVEQSFSAERAIAAMNMLVEAAAQDSLERLEGLWESNLETVQQLVAGGHAAITETMNEYARLCEQLQHKATEESGSAGEQGPAREAETPGPTSAPTAEPASEQAKGTVVTPKPESGSPSPAAEPQEEQRVNKAVPMIMKQNKPDYRTWLGVMVTSKMRRQATTEDLAWFLSDNDEALEQAKREVSSADWQEFEAAKTQQWEKIGPG
jgi:hypothetical protein